MGTTAEKLTYLNTTKGKIKDSINLTGAGITANDTFRSYATKLRDGLLDIINNGTIVLYNNFPKVSETGSNISLTNTLEAPMFMNKFDGDTLQDGTPTPDNEVPIQCVEGIQNITISDGTNSENYEINLEGKNLFDKNAITSGKLIQINGNEVTNADYGASNYIPVKANTQYTRVNCNNYYGAFYDSNKNFVGAIQNANTITPSVDGYVRISFLLTNVDSVQLELGNTATSYVPYREPIKLYNGDYITGTPDNWSIYRENAEVILNENNLWSPQVYGGYTYISGWNDHYFDNASKDSSNITTISDYFQSVSWNDRTQNIPNSIYLNISDTTKPRLELRNSQWATIAELQTWLSTHNTKVVYKLATPTTEQITDTYLISQLNVLYNAKSYNGQTNISVEGNLPMILEVSALKGE